MSRLRVRRHSNVSSYSQDTLECLVLQSEYTRSRLEYLVYTLDETVEDHGSDPRLHTPARWIVDHSLNLE